MNSKIQKLAEQAAISINSVYTPPVRSKEPGKIWEDGHIGWHELFQEKFAELIITECANACLEKTSPDSAIHIVSVAYSDAVVRKFADD